MTTERAGLREAFFERHKASSFMEDGSPNPHATCRLDAESWPCVSVRYAALLADPVAVDGTGSGTTTDCPLDGVHEHAFRGPHIFTEWYEPPRRPSPRARTPGRAPMTDPDIVICESCGAANVLSAERIDALADPVALDVEAWMESERLRQIKDHEARGGWSDGFRAGVHALAARLRENTEADHE